MGKKKGPKIPAGQLRKSKALSDSDLKELRAPDGSLNAGMPIPAIRVSSKTEIIIVGGGGGPNVGLRNGLIFARLSTNTKKPSIVKISFIFLWIFAYTSKRAFPTNSDVSFLEFFHTFSRVGPLLETIALVKKKTTKHCLSFVFYLTHKTINLVLCRKPWNYVCSFCRFKLWRFLRKYSLNLTIMMTIVWSEKFDLSQIFCEIRALPKINITKKNFPLKTNAFGKLVYNEKYTLYVYETFPCRRKSLSCPRCIVL